MITTANFKKQIGRSLAYQIKELGFKGSGFNYVMDTEDFIFAIGIQASRDGGQCCLEFGIQPKSLTTDGSRFLNFKKLKCYDCEFRARLSPSGNGDYWWTYSDNEIENKIIADSIVMAIKELAIPVIDRVEANPNFLEEIEPKDLDNLHNCISEKLNGLKNLSITEIRMAWALTKTLEKRNLEKAKMFAQYGLSKIKYPSSFFGIEYFEEIVEKNNGA